MSRPSLHAPSSHGGSLISVLVASGIVGILALVMAKMMTDNNEMASKTDQRVELTQIKRQIVEALDCEQTLQGLGLPASCSYIDLRKRNGFLMQRDPAATGPFAGSGVIAGQWYARARCGATSLVIEIARRAKGSAWTFAKDPVKKTDLDFEAAKHRLYGDPSTPPSPNDPPTLCGEYFIAGAGTNTIPAGAVIPFNRTSCPAGWAPFNPARGRVVVGAGATDPTLVNRAVGDVQPPAGRARLTARHVPPHRHDLRLGAGTRRIEWDWVNKAPISSLTGLPCNLVAGNPCGLIVNGDYLGPFSYADPAILDAVGNPVGGAGPDPLPEPTSVALLYCQKT